MPADMTPIRPSAVETWNRCPRLWHFREQGWRAPDHAWTPERLLGTAIHAGIAHHWMQKMTPPPEPYPHGIPSDSVYTVFAQHWPETAPPELSYEGVQSQALKVLDAVLKWIAKNMPEPDIQPVMVERTLRNDGCTPDLVTREPIGLVVTDWKTSANLPADRIQYRLQDLEKTHQFLDYAWQVGQTLGEPVRMVRKVVIACAPQIRVKDGTFLVDAAMLAAWHRDAEAKWALMNEMRRGTVYPWRNEDGCLKYGTKWRCEMWEACWTCHGDEVKMAQFLVRDPARGEEEGG